MDKEIAGIVKQALKEDIAQGDITTNTLIPKDLNSKAEIILKAPGVVYGFAAAHEAFKCLDPHVHFKALVPEGKYLPKGVPIASIRGKTRALLSAERVALNFLSYLSAIATKTYAYVQQVRPFKVSILDTRKTTPTLRHLERLAVQAGGGVNHRLNLNSMVMIKDNHLAICPLKHIPTIIDRCKLKKDMAVELEVTTLAQLKEALASNVDIVLLDNMMPSMVRKAVNIKDKVNPRVLLEASGGIVLQNVRKYAATGVNRISIGDLTHTRQGIDMSLEIYTS